MHLPDELLLMIMEDPVFGYSDLYSLTLLSKRLHVLALQRYTSQPLQDVSIEAFVHGDRTALQKTNACAFCA
jgi:hypothetical protein